MKLMEQFYHDNKFYYKYELISEQEYMLTNVVNKLLNIDNFVIDYDNYQLQFNIKGYYFCINVKEIINIFDNNLYSYIDDTILDDGCVDSFGCVQLVICNKLPDNIDITKSLHMLHKDSKQWLICNDSKFKINTSINSTKNIDDGEIF